MKLQLAQRTELALRALRALEGRAGPARAHELAPELETTVQYLPAVLRPLVRAGWVESQPGPTGGYSVVTDLERRSLLELIELMEGLGDMRRCALRGSDCDEDNPCALHGTWVTVREDLIRRLAAIPVSSGRKDLDDDE